MVLTMSKENSQNELNKTTRTAATVFVEKLKTFKEIARIKYNKDPVNTAWQEAMDLFIEENKDVYLKRYEEVKKENPK